MGDGSAFFRVKFYGDGLLRPALHLRQAWGSIPHISKPSLDQSSCSGSNRKGLEVDADHKAEDLNRPVSFSVPFNRGHIWLLFRPDSALRETSAPNSKLGHYPRQRSCYSSRW